MYYNYFSDGHSVIADEILELSDISVKIPKYDPDMYYYLENDVLKSTKIENVDTSDSDNYRLTDLANTAINEI